MGLRLRRPRAGRNVEDVAGPDVEFRAVVQTIAVGIGRGASCDKGRREEQQRQSRKHEERQDVEEAQATGRVAL